jgi:hypothetical protein
VEVPARRSSGPSRVLYWFRTPPGVRVGGLPLDDETKRLIESRHPEIRFDWRQIMSGRQELSEAGAGRPPAQPPAAAGEGADRRRRRDHREPPAPAAPRAGTPSAGSDRLKTPPADVPDDGSSSHKRRF